MTTKQKLQRELSKLWKEKGFERYGHTCLICGKQATALHHYIPRSKSLALTYDIENAIPLCFKDHYLIHFSHNPEETRRLCEIIRNKRGRYWIEYIETKRRQNAKNNLSYLNTCRDELNN